MWWSLSGCARRGGQTSADDSSPRGRSGELVDERLRGRHRRRPQRVDQRQGNGEQRQRAGLVRRAQRDRHVRQQRRDAQRDLVRASERERGRVSEWESE